jgi:ATP-binding cassette subfamily F protein 3
MLHIDNLLYRIGKRILFEAASVHIPAGHKVGIVGRNGVGKSTLLALIRGHLLPEDGDIHLRKNARIDAVAQEAPSGDDTPLQHVLAADRERARLVAQLEKLENAETTDGNRIAELHARLEEVGAHAAPARAARILAGLGFDEAAQHQPLQSFSGGWRMRVALAAVLFSQPDLLLLDEPTNYLDLEAVLWLESHLRAYPYTVLLVSHDRDLLNRAVGSILHIAGGGMTLYRGGYDQFDRKRREEQERQEKLQQRQLAQRAHMQAFVDRFRYKASKARQAQSRLKALERMEPIAAMIEDPSVSFHFPASKPLRPPMLTMEKCAVGYEEGKPVLRDLTLRIDNDDRIALLGANGNGKSTFAKLLAGRLPEMSGEVRRSANLAIGYFAQHQIEDLDADRTAYEHLADILPSWHESKVRARLGAFGLEREKADTFVDDLSGGERARLVLAIITATAPQMLILDEPTNHLDVDAREALAIALNDFNGAVILISHDRHLIELVAERLWLVTDGSLQPWHGDLDDYRRHLLGSDRLNDQEEEKAGKPSQAKKRGRRERAERRAELAPLRQAVSAAEKAMALQKQILSNLETEFADPALYDGPTDRIAELNRQRSDAEYALIEAESAWLDAAEALEQAESEAG